jgi:hypothetical protein
MPMAYVNQRAAELCNIVSYPYFKVNLINSLQIWALAVIRPTQGREATVRFLCILIVGFGH